MVADAGNGRCKLRPLGRGVLTSITALDDYRLAKAPHVLAIPARSTFPAWERPRVAELALTARRAPASVRCRGVGERETETGRNWSYGITPT